MEDGDFCLFFCIFNIIRLSTTVRLRIRLVFNATKRGPKLPFTPRGEKGSPLRGGTCTLLKKLLFYEK